MKGVSSKVVVRHGLGSLVVVVVECTAEYLLRHASRGLSKIIILPLAMRTYFLITPIVERKNDYYISLV